MFNNLVNAHDLLRLAERVKQGQLNQVLSRLAGSRQERIARSWKHVQNPPTNWWDIPAVRERWNYLISGNVKVDYYEYVSRKHLSYGESLSGLSLACGTGHRELRWAELGRFKSIDAYDLSQSRIEYASNKANEKGYGDIISYHVADVYDIEMRECYYDIVLAEQSLHHFSPLEKILLRINRFLKPNGHLIVNEFVGPTRFQWTDRQLEVASGLLSVLPVKYRVLWNSSSVKSKAFRPSRLSMMLSDPSEAVESSRIMPLLYEIFDVIEVREYGGSVLNLVFSAIAHNFLSEDDKTQRFIRLCFEIEDLMLESGDIQSDFAVVVCKKRLSDQNPPK